MRRGLPRVEGGNPWPPAGSATVAAVPAGTLSSAPAAADEESAPAAAASVHKSAATASAPISAPAVASAFDTVSQDVTLRQGLPRVAGGDPWPPAGTVTVTRAVAPEVSSGAGADSDAQAESSAVAQQQLATDIAGKTPTEASVAAPAVSSPAAATPAAPAAPAATASHAAPVAPVAPTAPAAPTPKAQAGTVAPSQASRAPAAASPEKRAPITIGSRTLSQWTKLAVLWGGGAILAAGIIVLAARGVTTLPGVPEFMERYPGEYHLPAFVADGFPAWARWSHFLNLFLMVLIIRSGLLVRQQQKPDAFFTPKKGGKKISIYLWMHTSLDILWLANGVFFVVLLFVSGHWARIVPTSWEVFPNAASAMLQYLTLEWPVEDGWVNYNSLQQIMYFTVVFIAAPLAAITGVRMSEWWPQNAEKLNRLYPAPVARALHFPVMLFFVLFIIIHVFLVLTTGALKNLNHMFWGTPEISWVGFWWFAAAVLVTAGVTWAARPLVLAPIAGAFGRVSER